MLKSLTIKNFAIIERYELNFGSGLNIITGETGAGKSILLKALGGLIGEKISSDYIRKGSELADIQAIFSTSSVELTNLLKEHELLNDENPEEVQIRKVIKKDTSKAWVNSVAISNSLLSQIGKFLIQALSQNQQQKLTSATEQLKLLNTNIDETLFTELSRNLSEQKSIEKQLEKMNKDSQHKDERLAYVDHLLKEFSQFDLSLSEEEIESKISFIENAQFFAKELTAVEQALDDENGAIVRLDQIKKLFVKLSQKNNSQDFKDAINYANEALKHLDDMFILVQKNKKMLSIDDEELDELTKSAGLLKKVKNKYGSIDNVKEQITQLEQEAEYLRDLTTMTAEFEEKRQSLDKKIKELSTKITSIRKSNAKTLEKKINQELQTLHMQGAKVKVVFENQDPSSSGADKVEFQISSNAGEDFKALSQIASGGELSRIMLAIHQALNEKENSCFLLDEVDQGISGEAGSAVGVKLQGLAAQNQVIAITHLAQVAIYAKTHIFIEKAATSGGRVVSCCKILNKSDQEKEIARLIGNTSSQQSSLKHAKELLNSVKQ